MNSFTLNNGAVWLRRIGGSLLLCLAFAVAATAQPTADYFSTGTNGAGGTLPAGSSDLHWSVAVNNLSGSYTPATVAIPVAGAYYSSPWPDCQWISDNINCIQAVQGIYYYKIDFTLPLLDPCGHDYTVPNTFCLASISMPITL